MPLPTPLVTISADYLGGTPVFTGTRVPVQALFDYLAAGDSLDEFLAQYPTVLRDHAAAIIKLAANHLVPVSGAAE
jgi:uncharacterized protein (DUF433 family)